MEAMTITVERLSAELGAAEELYKKGRISKEQLMDTWRAYRNLFGNDFVAYAVGILERAKLNK